jgi:hypothetical protein
MCEIDYWVYLTNVSLSIIYKPMWRRFVIELYISFKEGIWENIPYRFAHLLPKLLIFNSVNLLNHQVKNMFTKSYCKSFADIYTLYLFKVIFLKIHNYKVNGDGTAFFRFSSSREWTLRSAVEWLGRTKINCFEIMHESVLIFLPKHHFR